MEMTSKSIEYRLQNIPELRPPVKDVLSPVWSIYSEIGIVAHTSNVICLYASINFQLQFFHGHLLFQSVNETLVSDSP